MRLGRVREFVWLLAVLVVCACGCIGPVDPGEPEVEEASAPMRRGCGSQSESWSSTDGSYCQGGGSADCAGTCPDATFVTSYHACGCYCC